MEKGQLEMQEGQQDMQKGQQDMQKSQEEAKNELKDRMEEANGWNERVKASQLTASFRGEAAEVLQTLPDTARLNLNSLYDALDLRFDSKYSKDYARLQMETRHQTPEVSLQEYAFEIQRLTTLAFSDFSANVREMIFLEYFVDGLKVEKIQRAVRMADVQDLKSALLYALKVEAATQASCIDRQSIRGARVTADAPCESPRRKEDISEVTSPETIRKIAAPSAGADGNIEAPSRRPCPENSKYSWKVENKFGAIDQVVRQVTPPSTSESDPWSDKSVRKDQRADPEIKQS
ncbi:uncharacterized protein TNCV_1537151 [Trichonephila clavipes]|nr:uncharacterized protein TNCV_1537151 [Trichonephila clavipes]